MSQERARPIRGLLMSALVAGSCCLAGCMGSGNGNGPSRLDFDPMIGGRPLPESAEKSPRAKERGDDNDPLLMPPADAGRGPAALAGAGDRSGERKDKEASPGAKLGDPRVSEGQDRLTQTSAGVPAKAAEGSYEQLQQQLESRGVVWQHLKTTGERGEWLFACSIPDPITSGVERHYEARAAGAYGLAAIRAVLADIEADLKQRGER